MTTQTHLTQALHHLRGQPTDEPVEAFLKKMEEPVVTITTDQIPTSPREWDNAGIIYIDSRNYRNLGDKDAECPFVEVEGRQIDDTFITFEEHDAIMDFADSGVIGKYFIDLYLASWNAAEDETRHVQDSGVAVVLPIYLFDHSGITISTGSFGDPWDSGQVGCIYCTKKCVQQNWNGDLKKATEQLEAEVKEYDDFIRGNVWYVEIETRSGDPVDSCGGFIGDSLDETGILDHFGDEYRSLVEDAWERRFDG